MEPIDTEALGRAFRRREALVALGGLAGVAFWRGAHSAIAADPAADAAAVCFLQPEVTEGPFWIANHLTRRNVTEGKHGTPLALHITVVDSGCKPISGADVEIWHADASGNYSAGSQRFLRGHQRADANGRVLFDTIYPGWYRGRTPHIHLKVHVGGRVVHTGQLFFSDAVTASVYRRGAYRGRGQADTSNGADMIYSEAGGSRAKVTLTSRSVGGYSGRVTVGVRT